MINLISGTILIIAGLTLGWNPSLISWYDLSSGSKKRNFDIEGLAAWLRNSLIAIGLIIITVYPVFTYFELQSHILSASLSFIVIGFLITYFVGESFK